MTMIWVLISKVADLPPPAGPFPTPTNQAISDFYVRLGMAIAAWQFIESELFWTYRLAVGASNEDALNASFHTPSGFKTRLDMTNEAVIRCGLDDAMSAKWTKLYGRALDKAKRRNVLAHSVVGFDPKRKEHAQLFMAKNLADIRNPNSFGQADILTGAQLESMMNSFGSLNNDLHAFRLEFGRLRTVSP